MPKVKECGAPGGIDCNDDGYLLSIPVGYDDTHWFPKQMPLENVEVLKLEGNPRDKASLDTEASICAGGSRPLGIILSLQNR